MTLIAGVAFHGVYMLVADTLLHNDEGGPKHVELPSGRTTRHISEEKGFELKQKIKLVNDHMAIAYATDRWQAALKAIEALQAICADRMLSSADIQHFFDVLKDPQFDDLSLIGLAMLSDGRETLFSNAAKGDTRTQAFGPCLFAGSGAVDFANTVAQRFPPIRLEGEPFHRAIANATSLVSTFYTREVNSRADEAPSPLSRYYGGAWEHAYIDNGRVKKLGDTTYFFWSVVEKDGPLHIRGPSRIIKRDYVGDFLVLRWLTEPRAGGIIRWDLQKCIAIEPTWVGEESGDAGLDLSDPRRWPRLESTLQVHDILITGRDGQQHVMCWTNWGGDTGIRFKERNTGTNVSFSVDTLAQIAHAATEAKRAREQGVSPG